MEMMLDKKQIWGISLSEYKMGRKTTESNHNVNNICNGGSRSFTKETRVLKMRSTVAGNWKLTMTNWEASSKLILLQLCKKLLKNSVSTFLWSCCIWSKLERWKNSISGCFMRWPKMFKKLSWSVIFSYYAQQIISGSDCDVQWKEYFIQPAIASSVVGARRTPKHLPKPNLYPKKVMITVWWSAAGLIHYSFRNPGEIITSEEYAQQVVEMHRKLQWPQPTLVNRMGPILLQVCLTTLHTTKLRKLSEFGY